MSLDVIEIAKISDGGSSKPQIQARVDLFKTWDIPSGSKILEIGCGQGDCTLAMAYLVGEQGHITGIDPAPLDYGSFIGKQKVITPDNNHANNSSRSTHDAGPSTRQAKTE